MLRMSAAMREWRNWQTRTFEGRVVHTIRVQVPFPAPQASLYPFIGCRLFVFLQNFRQMYADSFRERSGTNKKDIWCEKHEKAPFYEAFSRF